QMNKERRKNLAEKLWWFDAVYPLALALIAFTSLTYLVYSGTRQMRLSSIADNQLLQWSLTLVDRPLVVPDEVLVVSANPLTLAANDMITAKQLRDASAAAYANAIRTLGKA